MHSTRIILKVHSQAACVSATWNFDYVIQEYYYVSFDTKMKFLRHLGNTMNDQEKGNPRLFLTSTMQLENHDFRATIYYDLKRGLTYHESHKNFSKAFESIAPGKSTVSKWFREFQFGRSHFNGDDHCGRPVSAATQENAARVKELIREDTQITCKDL